jgi:hypothetical protein
MEVRYTDFIGLKSGEYDCKCILLYSQIDLKWQYPKSNPFENICILFKMMHMKKINFIKRSVFLLSIIMVVVSCEKDTSVMDNKEIFNTNFKEIEGEWISEKMCGGWTGGCSNYFGDTLTINEYGDFEITDIHSKYAIGQVKIISQDSINLKIKLDWKQGGLRLFSNDELFVSFRSNDTIIFDEECCDRWSFIFVRKE